jgi:glycosyltransferase involved in cell wall biosynthesis
MENFGVTVAIPVYNEERIIEANTERLLDYLSSLGIEHQLLIGSNGSVDGTVALGRELQRRHSQVEFFHLPERGVGRAFREFVPRARFPFLVSLDMDLSSDLSFVEDAVALAGSCAIVVGSKKLGPQKRSAIRKMASDAFLWCARRLTGLPYDDYSIGAKAYDVAFLRESGGAIDTGSSYVLDLCHAATLSGYRVVCIPVACEDRRRSKFSLPREGVYKFVRLFQLSVAHARRPQSAQLRELVHGRVAGVGPAGGGNRAS